MAENMSHMIADAIVVLGKMEGIGDTHVGFWIDKAQKEMVANPRVNVGVAVQHLLRAAWYAGYRVGMAPAD